MSIKDVKAKMAEALNSLTEHDLRNYFEHWQHRMQLCVNSEGNYFESDRSRFPEFVNRKSYRHNLVFLVCVCVCVCVRPRIFYFDF